MMAVSGSSPRVCNKIYNCCCKCNFGKIVQILDISTFFVHILQEWLVSSYHTTVLLLTRARLCQTVQTVWATRTSSSFVTFLFPPQNHPSSISRDWQWVVGYKMRIIIILHIFFRLVRPRYLPPPPPHTDRLAVSLIWDNLIMSCGFLGTELRQDKARVDIMETRPQLHLQLSVKNCLGL